jgi:hypothetical protein
MSLSPEAQESINRISLQYNSHITPSIGYLKRLKEYLTNSGEWLEKTIAKIMATFGRRKSIV